MGAKRYGSRAGLLTVGAGLALLAGCSALGGDDVVTVLVDYDHDEFATQFIKFFPDAVQVHPGDRILFKQSWTGEPHTVTFGTLVEEPLSQARPVLAEYGHLPYEQVPPDAIEIYIEADSQLPKFYDDSGPPDPDAEPPPLPQAIAQPCFIQAGDLPEVADPCEVRELPTFDGTASFYNSGIIPYEGPGGNAFELQLADDIAPGVYSFYCAIHGAFQNGTVEVVDPDEPVPAPRQVAEELRSEVSSLITPFEQIYAGAAEEQYRFAGEEHPWNYAGLLLDDTGLGIINEFVPEEIVAEVDQPVTWRMFGPHSLSFDVPEYFPIVEWLDDGTVRENEAIWEPAGGAPPFPEEEEMREAKPLVIDGGTYDGDGFWSSGVLWNEAYVEYTLRFSTPGTYPYACLIHPPMVGTVRVTE